MMHIIIINYQFVTDRVTQEFGISSWVCYGDDLKSQNTLSAGSETFLQAFSVVPKTHKTSYCEQLLPHCRAEKN